MNGRETSTAVVPLQRGQWPELYRLMVMQKFPDLPPRFADAQPFFDSASLFGVMDGSTLAAGFVFGPPQDGICFFDVVCAPNHHGRWATPAVIRALVCEAFERRRLRCVWVQCANKRALKAALAAGFVPATPLDVTEPVLVMTPFVARRWMNQNERKTDGKLV